MFRILSAVILLSLLFSCRSTKKLQSAVNKKDTVVTGKRIPSIDSLKTGNDLVGTLLRNRINFKTFSAKIKVEYEDSKGKNQDLTAIVRIIKDSAIWISLTATLFNFEAYRILIKKDSIILLNKQDKEVQYRSIDYLTNPTQ